LAAALAAGLTSNGVRVANFGYATTPAMFMSTITEGKPQNRVEETCFNTN
jgi:phosphomannomutase